MFLVVYPKQGESTPTEFTNQGLRCVDTTLVAFWGGVGNAAVRPTGKAEIQVFYREREVLALVVTGLLNKQIAADWDQ